MKVKTFLTLFLFILAFTFAGATSADGIKKRIKFAKGKSSATYSWSVVRGDRDIYIAGASAGQTMSVKITSLEDNAVFQIEKPNRGYLDNAGETDDQTNWRGTLPSSGDYRIIVGGTRGNASYKLTVSIK